MKAPSRTIPSAFVRFDSTTTGADEFVNVRDMQTFAENHNILLAKRVRKLACAMNLETGSGSPLALLGTSMRPGRTTQFSTITIPLLLNQWTKSIDVVVRAASTAALGGGENVYLTARLSHAGEEYESSAYDTFNIDSADPGSGATEATYRMTVDVQRQDYRRMRVGYIADILTLTGRGFHNATPKTGTHAIYGVGHDWIDVPSASLTVSAGDLLWVDTDLTISPRTVVETVALGATEYGASATRLYLDAPWSKIPRPGTDTVKITAIVGVNLWSVSVYENDVTTFETWDEI